MNAQGLELTDEDRPGILALSRLRKEVVESMGQERARSVLTRFGFSLGYQIAVESHDRRGTWPIWTASLGWLKRAGWIYDGGGLLDHEDCEVLRVWYRDSWEAAAYLRYDTLDQNSMCWAINGFLSGYSGATQGHEICFIESDCHKDGVCQTRGKPRHLWEPEVLPLLQFFQEEDIESELSSLYEQLRRTHEHLSDLSQCAPDAIVALGDCRLIRVFNRSAERIFGFKAFEVLGRPIDKLLPSQHINQYTSLLQRMLRRKAPSLPKPLEVTARRADGSEFPIEVSLSISHFERDPLLTIIARDITERKKLEAEREFRTIELEATLDSTSDGLLMVRFQGPCREIIFANRRIGELLNASPAEFIGTSESTFLELIASRRISPDCGRELAPRHGESERIEIRLGDHGSQFIETYCGLVRDSSGEIIGRIWSFRDVTAQVEAEKQIQGHAEQLEKTVEERTKELHTVLDELREADEMKTRFISNVSHDFRTPLTSIHGFAETILREPEMPNDTVREFLKIMDDEAQRLSHLIEDLLDMSRMEAGRFELHIEPLKISELAIKLRDALKPQLENRGVSMHVERDEHESEIEGDPERLYRVMQNLVSNAIKFTPSGGKINVRIAHLVSEEGVRVSVADSGMGIPEEDLSRVFDRFHQVDRPKMNQGGTGLGLSIVKTLVEAHHGTISVSSRVGVGTTFVIELPKAQKATTIPESAT